MAAPLKKLSIPDADGGFSYFSTNSLTSAEKGTATAKDEDSVNPIIPSHLTTFFIFGPVVLFFVLFVIALGMQIVNRTLNRKQMVSALILSFIIATIPITLRLTQGNIGFSTRAGPSEIPRNVKVIPAAAGNILISWETDELMMGAVRIGEKPLRDGQTEIIFGDNGVQTSKHTVQVKKLVRSQTYEIEIFSGTRWYTHEGSPIEFIVLN